MRCDTYSTANKISEEEQKKLIWTELKKLNSQELDMQLKSLLYFYKFNIFCVLMILRSQNRLDRDWDLEVKLL